MPENMRQSDHEDSKHANRSDRVDSGTWDTHFPIGSAERLRESRNKGHMKEPVILGHRLSFVFSNRIFL